MTAPISNGPTTTRLHHYAGHYLALPVDGPSYQANAVTEFAHGLRWLPVREKIRPTPPLQWLFREKVLPARAKTPNLGQFERTGRTFSRFHDLTATQGELFRARRRRPSSALPISDLAPQVWRAPEGTEG